MTNEVLALKIHARDNVATLLQEAGPDSVVVIKHADGSETRMVPAEPIEYAHKMALEPIDKGAPVVKYGEIMGTASAPIEAGRCVHVHNCESTRARGDQMESQDSSGEACVELSAEEKMDLRAFDGLPTEFKGFVRDDGRVGTRNYIGVLSAVACANDVVSHFSTAPDVAVFTHQQGCSQTLPDVRRVENVLIGLGKNPNLAAVVVVGLGCESVRTDHVVESLRQAGKSVAYVCIQEAGGKQAAIEAVQAHVQAFKRKLQEAKRVPCSLDKLVIGLKCGSSDTTQGVSANPVIGRAVDWLIAQGASVLIGETTEFMGAEHIAAARARTPEIGRCIVRKVNEMERRALSMGVDMRGGQPTRGNIAGGLTTIEEKSLGALAKSGSSRFEDVIEYGEPIRVPGLSMMDSPGREPELLTGVSSSGASLVLFATGRGAPQGFPFVPVIKITGNPRTLERMREHMDCDVSGVMNGTQSLDEAARVLLEQLLRVIDGEQTKAEQCHYVGAMNIYTTGPTI